jgi:hypothetical protein
MLTRHGYRGKGGRMVKDVIQLAMQAHLAEFAVLRQEILELLKWGDQLVFISLATSGALFSFAFSAPASDGASPSRRLALYLIPPLSTAIGGLWFQNRFRIRRIGRYLRDVIAPRVNASLAIISTEVEDGSKVDEVLTWQSSHQRYMYRWSERILGGFAVLMSFFSTGALAQALILQGASGSMPDRIRQLEFPTVFVINSVMLFIWLAWISGLLIRDVFTDSKN